MLIRTSPSLLLAGAGLTLFDPVLASCECGHSMYLRGLDETTVLTDAVESNLFNITNMATSTDWRAQNFNKTHTESRGPYGEMFSADNIIAKTNNVYPPSQGLQLVVGSKVVDGMVPTAEIATRRDDFFYGSYRASIRMQRNRGTCAAFYWYFNDTQEIDIEILTKSFDFEDRVFPINIVLHSTANLDPDYDAEKGGTWAVKNLPFDPTDGFHEYRFDWAPGAVTFYADSRVIGQMFGDAVPNHPGHVLLSHWSNGDDEWSGGPPTRNSSMTVRYFNAYFNSTDPDRRADWRSRCTGRRLARDAICRLR